MYLKEYRSQTKDREEKKTVVTMIGTGILFLLLLFVLVVMIINDVNLADNYG